jgi:hypothetical protein
MNDFELHANFAADRARRARTNTGTSLSLNNNAGLAKAMVGGKWQEASPGIIHLGRPGSCQEDYSAHSVIELFVMRADPIGATPRRHERG